MNMSGLTRRRTLRGNKPVGLRKAQQNETNCAFLRILLSRLSGVSTDLGTQAHVARFTQVLETPQKVASRCAGAASMRVLALPLSRKLRVAVHSPTSVEQAAR